MELLRVAAVLPLGPRSHLIVTHHGEKGHRKAKPGAQLKEEVHENTYVACHRMLKSEGYICRRRQLLRAASGRRPCYRKCNARR